MVKNWKVKVLAVSWSDRPACRGELPPLLPRPAPQPGSL